jgi:predicted regulator of Ras-like GTPase activity (Roadblock/LC7/MglB family)
MIFTTLRMKMSKTLADLTRPRGTAGLIRRAEQCRREGRFEEAGELVGIGLRRSPQHVLGHLLRAYLHVACRNPGPAKTAFAHVLSLDSHQPRALLGLARIALDEGDHWSGKEFLKRALKLYPDFPEAAALLDVINGSSLPKPTSARGAVPVTSRISPALRRTPAGGRDLALTRDDGSVVFAETEVGRSEELGAQAAQVLRIASTTLSRCRLGALRSSVVEYSAETVFARCEDGLTLSVAFPRDVEIGFGLLALDNLWADTATSAVNAMGVPA